MKILITGSNGLLGQHLVRLLRKEPANRVIATARGENRLKDREGYGYEPLDVTDSGQVGDVVGKFAPDVIIHAAAMTQVDDCELKKEACWEANVRATQYLVKAAGQCESSFLLVSTDFIFNGESGPYPEDAVPDPLSYYGMSKLAAEMLLPSSSLNWAIARTVLVYGVAEDMSRSNIILWVKKSLEEGKKIRVVDDQWRTPTLVQDLAQGCALIAHRLMTRAAEAGAQREGTVYNISGKDLLTPYQMAIQVAEHFGLDASLIEKADASTFSQKARRPPRTGFVIDKARKELGYEPHSFEEGIAVVAAAL
jgi:dTDP-4-dehydrorhamnose reductase